MPMLQGSPFDGRVLCLKAGEVIFPSSVSGGSSRTDLPPMPDDDSSGGSHLLLLPPVPHRPLN